MKGLYESLRQKELELQRALDDAAEANERELRRIQKSLQEALGAVDQLLGLGSKKAEVDPPPAAAPAESEPAERSTPPLSSDLKKVMRSSQSAIAACFGQPSVREFP